MLFHDIWIFANWIPSLQIPNPPLQSPLSSAEHMAGSEIWRWRWLKTCFKSSMDDAKQKQRAKESGSVSKTSSVHAVRSSPNRRQSYSSMNAEERDENLKAAIIYCNNKSRLPVEVQLTPDFNFTVFQYRYGYEIFGDNI